jgi:osmotically-inducible protein OsmY
MARRWEERGRSERGRYRGGGDERDWADRMGDEARSWMGDEEAEHRRRMDERRDYGGDDRGPRYVGGAYYGGSYRGRGDYGAGGGGTGRYSESDYEAGYRGRAGLGRSAPAEYRDYERPGYAQRPREYGRRDHDPEDRGFLERASDEVASWFGDEEAERRRRMDQGHRGRGPKGYTRSDDRIRDDVSDVLSDDWSLDASDVEVSVSNREVSLNGTVSDRAAKRRAEDLAESVSGVQHVQNNLRVSSKSGMSDQSATSAGATTTTGSGSTRTGGGGL